MFELAAAFGTHAHDLTEEHVFFDCAEAKSLQRTFNRLLVLFLRLLLQIQLRHRYISKSTTIRKIMFLQMRQMLLLNT